MGYDRTMTDSTPENESGPTQEPPEQGLISDEQLPEDLQPDKNPMAQAPDADPDGDGPQGAQAAPGGPPEVGQPG